MECKGYPKANKNCSMLCTNFGFTSFCFSFADGCRSGFLGGNGMSGREDPALDDDPKAALAPCVDVDVDVREKPRGST